MQATLRRKLRGSSSAARSRRAPRRSQTRRHCQLRRGQEFGSVTATAVAAVRADRARRRGLPAAEAERPASYQPGHMRRRLDQLLETHRRYGHPFGLVVFDVDGPGDAQRRRARRRRRCWRWSARRCARASASSTRPSGSRRTRSACSPPTRPRSRACRWPSGCCGLLAELEAAGGLPIGISAGVVACPEHGNDAEAPAAQGRRGDVASPCGGPAGGRRPLARSLTDSGNLSITCVNLDFGWENARCPRRMAAAQQPRRRHSDARDKNKRRRRSARASAPTRCAAGSAATASRRRSAPRATTATTSWSSCRRCATRWPRPATSPRRSS